MIYYSQDKQDKFLDDHIFKGIKCGIFVDVGAHNGETFNNTLFFEETHQWTGINIEPMKVEYDKLIAKRPNCINLNCAVCNEDGEMEFMLNTGVGADMLSGLIKCYDPRHVNRINNELHYYKGSTETVLVETRRLKTIFEEHKIARVNYLSIDVEGAEFDVIKSIDFDNVFIDVIGFENNYNDVSIPIVEYLVSKGYLMIDIKALDIFMIHKDSEFIKNLQRK